MSKLTTLLVASLALAACDPVNVADAGRDVASDVARDAFDASDAPADAVDVVLTDAEDISDAAEPNTDYERLQSLVTALGTTTDDAARRTMVDAFMRRVAYGTDGFPIHDNAHVAWVFWDPDNMPGSVSVAGDFDTWALEPMQQPVAGLPFYVRIDAVAMPSTRSLYKFVRSDTIYFADPWARRFGWDANGQFSLFAAGTDRSHLERWPSFDDHVGTLRPRDLFVYVPSGPPSQRASVLYMHDGQNLFDPSAAWGGWHVGDAADAAIASGGVHPFFVVAIPNTADRMDEYTHTNDDIGTGTNVGGRASEYESFVIDGVKPFVDARYNTLADRAHTGVMGSSLGGLVSVYFATEHPEVFGFAGSMSGTFGWGSIGGNYNRTLMNRYATGSPVDVTFYIDSGGTDGGGCVDSDGDGVHDDTTAAGDNYCETLDMIATLEARGAVTGTTLFYANASGAMHNEAAWAARFPDAIRTWFPSTH